MKLIGEHLYLRPLHVNDALGDYPSWLNDRVVCQYNSHGDTLYTQEMALSYIQSMQNNLTCKVFAMCDKTSDKHIGNIALQAISPKNKSAEFAILLGDKAYWGKGLSKEAGKLLLDYGFDFLKLHRIYCGTSEANVPMQHLARSLGMELEGRRKEALLKHENFYDVLEYGIVQKPIQNRSTSDIES
ncbi:GNAT family N-acetyltransferase [Sulfurospirillum diekertiae]|uniref:Spermidine N(1)-acetyltransferase n=1 Tax=Sulfurospirillum diekertiae TaxID=1854492 RepID=A0A1Y0HPJ8_9BACT|nr:GNAT family protein [Sulfurospirillum diekertiae]ARU50047.1 Spermidine N(1)-acetyltransferase [Sulfurospirillum diekertiae]ASC94835.1 Spermidine N(1)-acetyltransferase [Sulfurospirillum diekertiae]